MRRRKKTYTPKPKVQPENTIDGGFTGIVTSEPETVTTTTGKIKQIFNTKTSLDNDLTCICWNKYSINKGDTITAVGRLNTLTNHIVIWSLHIIQRDEQK